MKQILLKFIFLTPYFAMGIIVANGQRNDTIKVRKDFIGLNLPGVYYDILPGFSASPAIGYERSLSKRTSFGGDITLYFGKGTIGFMVRPEIRYYFKIDSIKRNIGWYLGAQIFEKSMFYYGILNNNHLGTNVCGGYQWIWKNNMFFNLGLGWGPPRIIIIGQREENKNYIYSTYLSKNWLNFEIFVRLGYSF